MQPSTPTSTAAPLARLEQLHETFTRELKSLPKPRAALSNQSENAEPAVREAEIVTLITTLEDYWQAPSAKGSSRRELFIDGMEHAVRDEVTLNIQEGSLAAHYAACLPSANQADPLPEAFTLHVQLNDTANSEITGALVFMSTQGHCLLVLPGVGTQGFASHSAMGDALVQWLNDDVLRHALFNNLEQRDRDLLDRISKDPELYLEPFNLTDLQLQPVTGKPFEQAFERQLQKQQHDLRHGCVAQTSADAETLTARLEAAIAMEGLFGPGAMLEQRKVAEWEHQQRKNMPHWVKIANQDDLTRYQQHLTHYDQSREVLLSALGGAASHEQYARMKLRARLASDLGYDLEPGQITVTTQRPLPITGETYAVTHSLLQLALYGLHPGDSSVDSAFMTQTAFRLDGALMQTRYPSLTTSYVAGLVDELNLKSTFGDYQRTAYAAEHNQQLMRELTRKQVTAQAWAAKMQGHIEQSDFEIIEQIDRDATGQNSTNLHVQQIKLNDADVLGGLLVFCKNDALGHVERLVMFAADAPRPQQFQGFHNQTQLIHELVGWTKSAELSRYLLEQIPASSRERLEERFAALRLKPQPTADYVQLVPRTHYHQALGQFVRQHVRVATDNQRERTPQWFLRATAAQRQELLALEEAINGATRNYQAKAHTKNQPFDAYVHQRASKKISELLGVTEGSVDPDQIIITTEREVLTYTQMLRNGYDDSLGLLSSSADTQATFKGPANIDLSPLTPQKVARSVHGKWLSDDYIKQVRQTLLAPNSPGYEYRRQTSLLITVLQMKAAALRSYLKGQLDITQYQWLKLSMENLHRTHSDARRNHPVYPLQLRLENPLVASDLSTLGEIGKNVYDALKPVPIELTQIETVQGCYVLSSSEAGQATLLYTPNAPDGLEFRLLSDFKASLSHAAMIDYYKDRCRPSANRKLAFFLRDMEQGGPSKPPVIPKEAIADFREVCFNRPIERQLREVEDTTTGRSDMLARLVWMGVELIVIAVTLPFPPASFAVGAALALRDSAHALQAYADGDLETASNYILSSWLNTLGAGADLSVGMKGFGALRKIRSSARQSAHLAPAELTPVNLEGEMFWLSRPNANGHASVFRANPDQSKGPLATGQFARREKSGTWQPLSQPAAQPAPLTPEGIKSRFAVDLSLKDVAPAKFGHRAGVRLIDGKYYIELQAHVFEVQFDASARCWNIIDPHNPFAFFGKRPVRLDDQGQWQLIERRGLRGGAADSFTPLQSESAGAIPSVVTPLELPLEMRPHFEHITNPLDPMGWGLEEYFDSIFREMRSTFNTLREKLYREADAFFTSVTPAPRPALPLVDVNTGAEGLIKKVLANNTSMIVSEAPRSIASKRFLIRNMALLAEQNVEILYIPHLFTDLHMGKLEKYRKLGGTSRAGSSELKLWLESLNAGYLRNASKEFDYYHLIKAAHQQGIEVRPLSSALSYPLNNHPVAWTGGDIATAQKMSNFFAHTLISADVAANPSRRWVALLDQRLANTYQTVPGISELQGSISVRVQDLPGGMPTRVSRDIGGSAAESVRADFRIEMATSMISDPHAPRVANVIASAQPSRLDEALLKQIHGEHMSGINNPYVGKPGFEWAAQDGWQTVDAVRWGAETEPTAIQLSLQDNVYGIPSGMRDTLYELVNFERRGLDASYFISGGETVRVRYRVFNLRSTLQKDASAIVTSELPVRPPMPTVTPGVSPTDFLEDLYQHTQGVIIGEAHSSIASKKLLIESMPSLSRQNVKTLYMEHLLSDLHQADLDRFAETGHMSKALLHDLKKLDRGHLTDPSGLYNFEQVVIKAQEHGLEIRAIDCAASYHLKGLGNSTPTTRQQMFSYFASRTIRKHQEVMGSHKWIALVGSSHANTFEGIVPGLAELENGIGVRVVDVAPGKALGVFADPGEELMDFPSGNNRIIKNDFRIEMDIARPPLGLSSEQLSTVEQRLTRPGMFLLEEGENQLQIIVHRSRDRTIHRTPIMVDTQGKFYVERPRWPSVNLQPFDDVEGLITALEGMEMRRVI